MGEMHEFETIRERQERLKRTKSSGKLRLKPFVLLLGSLLLIGLVMLALMMLVQPQQPTGDTVRVPLQLPLQSIYAAQRG
jgi:hypothetical protein